MIIPQTDVILLKVPLEMDDMNQLTFANRTEQYNYFTSLPQRRFDDFTYQRKEGVLRLPALIDDIQTYNYVMYQNEGYTDKWFYAFVTSTEYVNENTTIVNYEVDVMQIVVVQIPVALFAMFINAGQSYLVDKRMSKKYYSARSAK